MQTIKSIVVNCFSYMPGVKHAKDIIANGTGRGYGRTVG